MTITKTWTVSGRTYHRVIFDTVDKVPQVNEWIRIGDEFWQVSSRDTDFGPHGIVEEAVIRSATTRAEEDALNRMLINARGG